MRKRIISMALAAVLGMGSLVLPAAAAEHPFRDVDKGAWFSEAVQYVYEHELMNGMETTEFGPDRPMSRAMLITVLHRMDGETEAETELPFTDISTAGFYYDALEWGYAEGIIKGMTDSEFSPDLSITREMMVAMFYRYADYKGLDTQKRAELGGYADAQRVAEYAKEPFEWAVAEGIINGMSERELGPQGLASRAQCAAVLQRFDGWVTDTEEEHEHRWVEHTVTEQVLVKEGYYEPVYDFVDHGYEDTVIASDGTDLTGKSQEEIDQYIADHPGVTVEVKSEWIVGWEIVDYEWVEPVYETVTTVDYEYCEVCGVHK